MANKTYKLMVCVDNDVDSDDALWITIGTPLQAGNWGMAHRKFKASMPEVMARFGNGRISIVTVELLPEVWTPNLPEVRR